MSDQLVSEITSHIQDNIHQYFSDLSAEGVQVLHHSTIERPNATLLRYTITSENTEKHILAKIHHQQSQINQNVERPLRFYTPPDEKYDLYAKILQQIETLIQEKDDERFGYIRLLDTLPDSQTLIMTEIKGNDLRKPFLQKNRLQALTNKVDLQDIFYKTGVWLAAFHSLEASEHVEVRANTADVLYQDINQIIDYLSKYTDKKAALHKIQPVLASQIARIFEEPVPMGRMHGDFALRNILVDAQQRIIVLDTIGKWYTPIYEDIAYYLIRLWTNKLQVFTLGYAYSSKWIRQSEQRFLEGYFDGQAIPRKTIATYKVIMLLDQWVSLTESLHKSGSLMNKVRFQLTNRYYHQLLEQYLKEAN